MASVLMRRDIPGDSVILVNEARRINYLDSYVVTLRFEGSVSTDYLTRRLFCDPPSFVRWLLTLRDALVKPFGLKNAATASVTSEAAKALDVWLNSGDKAGPFTVSHRLEHEIVLAERDRHLDFRVSVHQGRSVTNALVVSVTTVVWFNNNWGKLYFSLIRPFHCAILRVMMKRLRERLLREVQPNFGIELSDACPMETKEVPRP